MSPQRDPDPSDGMVLELLAEAAAEGVPGEVLSDKLGLGPAEVYHLIDRLRVRGCRIDRSGRRYRLVGLPDRLTALELDACLTTHDFGRTLHHRESVPSTNDLAFELAREGAFHGETVISEHQTRGKGRRGRTWISPPGRNVYCSVILRPDLPARRAPEITFVAAVALAQALREALEVPAAIKWPNDLEIDGRKIAGILPELDAQGDRVRFMVLGFGLNVNMDEEELPAEVRERSTSLKAVLGSPVDRPLLTAALLGRLEAWYDRWIAEGMAPVAEAWRTLSSTLGRRVRVIPGAPAPELEGTALDLEPDGALRVRDEAGGTHRIVVGDVEHLRLR